MADELATFREDWKQELLSNKKTPRREPRGEPVPAAPQQQQNSVVRVGSDPRVGDPKNRYFEDSYRSTTKPPGEESSTSSHAHGQSECGAGEVLQGTGAAETTEDHQPQYVSIASSLLDGRTSPLLDRIQQEITRTRRKRQYQNVTDACGVSSLPNQPHKKAVTAEKLVDQLIEDLNEVNDIPFFDIELPYELAAKIFQYLNGAELGRCAQVSKAWKVLAEDGVLWFRLCQREGYHRNASVSDFLCWKSALRDCRNSDNAVRYNWKNRVGAISQLQYELGKVLCDVSSCDNFVLAGYTSGDVRLWDTLHWDSGSSYLKTNSLSASSEPRPHVSLVQVNRSVAAAAYEDGCVDLWSVETGGEPIHHYQSAGRVQALALSPDGGPSLLSAHGPDVRLDCPDDHGYWRTLCQAHLPNTVDSSVMVPGRVQHSPLATVVAGDSVYLLRPEDDEETPPRALHSVYGHPVTCLDATGTRAALGVKSSGWAMHDGGNKIRVYSLETGQSVACVGNSPGDFTCLHLRDDTPHLLTCGNKDRRVRVFDLRSAGGVSVASLYAHHLGVTSVRADDWKVVSGGGEGLVCVWELRMGAKLWEMHNRHPVRHVRFNSSTLITANVPDEKSPRGACISDDDLTAHRRHRGVICYYDFSEEATSQDHILPICRSDYSESHGYNYNIGLAVPYDVLSGALQPSPH